MLELLRQIKKTVVFLGVVKDGTQVPHATGFLVRVKGIYHLLTAKHVIFNSETGERTDQELHAFFNLKSGGADARAIADIKKFFAVDWILHDNSEVDIAVLPFGLNEKKDDVLTIPDDLFLEVTEDFELYEIFFLSFQPGIAIQERIIPFFRAGIISRFNEDNTFYVDASAFPGNSGSPVFLRPSPVRFTSKGINLGKDTIGCKFLGVVGSYVPYREVAVSLQTKRPRIIFEENTGLSHVWSVSQIGEITGSEAFTKQLEELQKLKNSTTEQSS